MKELFLIEDSLSNKISYYHLLLLLVSLPFDFFYSHVILISFAFHTLINVRKSSLARALQLKTLLLQSVFFVTVICTLYSSHKSDALQEWLRQLSIFLFPLLFCFTNLNLDKYRPKLLMVFALCCTLTVVYLYIDAFTIIRYFKYPPSTLFSKAFTNHNFSAPIAMHATFFSLQLGLSLIYLLSVFIHQKNGLNKIIIGVCCAILTAGIIQLCSKTVLVALLLSINIFFPLFVLRGSRRGRFMLITGALSALLIITIIKADTFRNRYITDLKVDLSKTSLSDTDDARLARWDAAGALVIKSPVWGYGTGTELSLLHNQFFAKKLYNSFLNNLNAHNQYISFLLVSGVLGLAVYMVTLLFGFKMALHKKDIVFFSLMMLVAIVSVAESFLYAEKGIYFYSLFFSFFVFADTDSQPLTQST